MWVIEGWGERKDGRGSERAATHRAEIGVLGDVPGHHLVFGRQGHDEEEGFPGLLAHLALAVDEGDEQGEDEEIGGALVLAGVEKQLQDGGVLG